MYVRWVGMKRAQDYFTSRPLPPQKGKNNLLFFCVSIFPICPTAWLIKYYKAVESP